MKTKIPASFEELIGSYYGSSDLLDKSNDAKVMELFTQGYGKPLAPKGKQPPPAAALSLRCDDGETLPQRKKRRRDEEYVVSQSNDAANVTAGEEYIVIKGEPPRENFTDVRPNAFPPQPLDVKGEAQVDVRQPLQATPPAPQGRTVETPPVSGQYVAPEPPGKPAQAAKPADKPSLFQKEESQVQSNDDDFFADMQSILTGEKVFDPASKTMVNKDQKGRVQPPPRQPEPAPLPPLPADNGQAIFDRIAQSMQYANAYDLGTVEMETRFDDFDKKRDRKAEEQRKPKVQTTVVSQSVSSGAADTTDFLQDLDTIRRQHDVMSAAASRSVVPVTTAPPVYSRPFYDTGEHVLMGGDMYTDGLHVGRDPGVLFSYGQIIAMGDLYTNFGEMMDAEFGELDWIKTLIESSTKYYQTNKKNDADDISHDQWDKATGGRYMQLALDNFEHFSPNLMLLGSHFVPSYRQGRDHKTQWERYHLAALEDAAQMFTQYSNQSFFPERALIINAFGDHFLTDAFASGHAINKAEMEVLFRAKFYSDMNDLNDDGEEFFEKVGKRAWQGKVKAEFSKLESSKWARVKDIPYIGRVPLVKHIPLFFNPDIDDASRFGKVLKGIAEEAPDHVINIAIKALHDRLNKEGIEVMNAAGDKPWRLTGDGYLTNETLDIARRAVKQSHDNVIAVSKGHNAGSVPGQATPAILDFNGLAASVWKHVPQFTPASRAIVQNLMKEYTNPKSEALIAAAAKLIEKQVELLIEMILKHGALQKA